MHGIGHNLGHGHSGKDGVAYTDPTCTWGTRALGQTEEQTSASMQPRYGRISGTNPIMC